jgi:hypothetical protein
VREWTTSGRVAPLGDQAGPRHHEFTKPRETGFVARHVGRLGLLAVLLVGLLSSPAFAQTTVSVVRDQVTIWQAGFTAPAVIVKAGTQLEVVGRQGAWYEVVLPGGRPGAPRVTGFVAVIQVQPVAGTPPPDTASARARRAQSQGTSDGFGVTAFGQGAYGWFNASKSFKAVTGEEGGWWYGGGVEVRLPMGIFVSGSFERYDKTGQRVFVSGGTTYQLGIPDTIRITPVTGTIGYRIGHGHDIPYVGVGGGRYLYRETSAVGSSSQTVDQSFPAYHVLVGFESRHTRWVSTAIEAQYTHVPNALSGLVADAFSEHNLGGAQVRLKVRVGR